MHRYASQATQKQHIQEAESFICGSWRIPSLNSKYLLNHPSWITVVTPNDRPKSERLCNQTFGGIFVLILFFNYMYYLLLV